MEQGWSQKLASLYRERYGQLYRAAYRIVERQDEAEDAVHTAFVRLLRMKGHYDALSGDELCYMAVCIVKHAALNMLRDEKKQLLCENPEELSAQSQEFAENAGASDASGAAGTGGDTLRELVRGALYQMPDAQCRLLWMKYYAGMSHQDIAAALHISRHAVDMRLHRARRELESRIKEER
ncbi:MAG: sigma-70 family RNA polymerase sigma factor [bacterium]|nr:sigma-70 family RNA polymerase sigma factor [bacterium]